MFNISLILFVAFSGVYLWQSGLPQLSHLVILFASTIFISKVKKIPFTKSYFLLFAFLVYSFVINFYYFVIYEDLQFVISSIQVFFNFYLLIIVVAMLGKVGNAYSSIVFGVVIGYTIQWFVLLLGIGNYTLYPRYSGTFNDPNQMAFWLLSTYSIFLSLKDWVKINNYFSIFLHLSFLIFISMTISRSAILAIIFFTVVFFLWKILKSSKIYFFLLSLLVFLFLSIIPLFLQHTSENIVIDRLTNLELEKQADERGYTRFSEYPEYIILGSGQGEHKRFNAKKSPDFLNVEMHTTWGGLLFYYGLFGFVSIAIFLLTVLLKVSSFNRIVLLSTFVYGISTYSFRTPIFWFLLAVFISIGLSMRKENNNLINK